MAIGCSGMTGVASRPAEELAAWVANEKPRLAGHQFSLAGLPQLVRLELLYALQRRDEAPPPLDPLQVRILISRLDTSQLGPSRRSRSGV